MEGYIHILLHGQKDRKSTYDELFTSHKPSKILVFSEQEQLNQGLIESASVHGVEPQRIPIESLDIPDQSTIEMIQSKPYTILSQMCDGIISQTLDSHSVIVPIFSGSGLHQSMLLLVAREFGFNIVLGEYEFNEEKTTFNTQEWISTNFSMDKLTSSQSALLLAFLDERLIEPVNPSKLTHQWRDANQISGAVIGGNVPKEEGFSVSSRKLISSGLMEKRGEQPIEYSLTGRGWIRALELWREMKPDNRGSRPSRIVGGLANKRDKSQQYNSIRIANRLPHVEDWITIISRLGTGTNPGITLFDEITNSSELKEVDQNEIDSIREEWTSTLESRDMSLYSWALLNVSVQNMENQFSVFCDWLWPRIMADGGLRQWCMDITQFPNNTVAFAVLFAQSLGIPITSTLAHSGYKGVGGKEVSHDVQDRTRLVIPLPDWKLIHTISSRKITSLDNPLKLLISLLHYEEEFHDARQLFEQEQDNLDPEDEGFEFQMSSQLSRQELEEWIEKSIQNGSIDPHLSVKLGNTTSQNKLRDDGLIFVEEVDKSRKHMMRLTPIGRIVALLVRKRILG